MKTDKTISLQTITGCRKGNRKQQRCLYDTLLPSFYTVARRYLYGTEHIEDVIQESFIQVFKSINNYDDRKGAFYSWSIKILIRQCLKYNQQKQHNLIDLDHDDIAIQPEVFEKYNREALLNILNKMPSSYGLVFKLHVIEGYNHTEIAELLDIKAELSRQRLTRAKSWLRDRIKKNSDLHLNII